MTRRRHFARARPSDDYAGSERRRVWQVTCPDCRYRETFHTERPARRAARDHRLANEE